MTRADTQVDVLAPPLTGAGPELAQLYQKAAENAALSHTDFYTIHDLLELSGLEAEEPLHALLLALLLALEEGSLCVEASLAGLAQRLADLADEPAAQTWAQRVLDGLRDNRYDSLVGCRLDDNKPVILVEKGGRRFVYFQKYLKHEQALCEELRGRLVQPAHAVSDRIDDILGEVLEVQPLRLAGQPLRLNGVQQAALGVALRRNLAVISGGPGTGKTSIVVTLLRCLVRAGIAAERIALAAPTGRAAQRLTDALHAGLHSLEQPSDADRRLETATASTLHQLLRYLPDRGIFLQHAENPLAVDVVIVDEVSMVGVALMAHLFQALAPATRLVLLGDKDQLSSVDAGAVLANLVGGRAGEPAQPLIRDALVILQENYRSQQGIQRVAATVNRQEPNVVDTLPRFTAGPLADLESQGGCWLLETASDRLGSWRDVLERWAVHHYLAPAFVGQARATITASGEVPAEERERLDALFALVNRARILTLVREGPWGCEGINEFLEQKLRPRLDRTARGAIFAGAPVLVTRNDRALQLFNGDVGVALRSPVGGCRVLFQKRAGYLAVPADALPPHEPAFAMTVHKSQGSEYDQVLLVLPPEGGRRLLTKEMIYTGITRAKQLALVCSPPEVLKLALARRIERQSALLSMLGE